MNQSLHKFSAFVTFATAGMLTSPAYAIVSEADFKGSSQNSTTPSRAHDAATNQAAYFLPKRVLRVNGVQSSQPGIAARDGKSALTIERDSLDGSVSLRKGLLPIHFSEIVLSSGKTLNDVVASPMSVAEKDEAQNLLATKIIEVISKDPSMKFKTGYLALNKARTLFDAEFSSMSFSLFIKGRKVNGAEMTARFKDGQWVSWVSESFGTTEGLARITKASTQVVLKDIAKKRLGPAFGKITAQNSVWIPEAGSDSYTLIPAIESEVLDTAGQLYTLTVSEADGSVLEFYARKYNFDGKISGTYYTRHPKSGEATTGLPYVSVKTGGIFGRKTYTADKEGNLKVPRVDEVVVKLSSPFVQIKNSGGKDAQITATDDVVFDGDTNSTMAETTAFFHLSVVNDFVREKLGNRKLAWLDKQLTTNVNINDSCNAYYDGSSVNFFKAGSKTSRDGTKISCSNTGEIADVMYHEWGHGLDDNTGGIDDGAFSEAIGDTVSALITLSPEVGPYFMTDGKPVRNLDDEYQYPPKDDMREVHKEGLIFGSTWFHLTEDLVKKYGTEVGRDTSARLFLKLIYTASSYTQAYDAAVTIDAGAGDAKGPNFCLINGAFSRHGLAKKDSTCRG